MVWQELKCDVPGNSVDSLSDLLSNAGALAVTCQDAGDQPIYELPLGSSPTWDHVIVTGLFEAEVLLETIIREIQASFPKITFKVSALQHQDWAKIWMTDLEPRQFGQRLWIVPSFSKFNHPHQVSMDPGLAFGTGQHPTTALCLEWLDQHLRGDEVLIDYGCGSGILAIAAIKLGAKKAYAIDHDPQALVATTENANKNHLLPKQLIAAYSLEQQECADILIANILANPLIDLAKQFAQYVRAGGKIALSGILTQQTEAIMTAYEPWFRDFNIAERSEWVRIDGRRYN